MQSRKFACPEKLFTSKNIRKKPGNTMSTGYWLYATVETTKEICHICVCFWNL